MSSPDYGPQAVETVGLSQHQGLRQNCRIAANRRCASKRDPCVDNFENRVETLERWLYFDVAMRDEWKNEEIVPRWTRRVQGKFDECEAARVGQEGSWSLQRSTERQYGSGEWRRVRACQNKQTDLGRPGV